SRELKGVPGRWDLFSLDAVDGEAIGPPLDPQQAAEYRLLASPPNDRARQRRWLIPIAALTSLLFIGGLLLLQRRGSGAAPPTSSGAGAITESLAVLSARSGALSKRVSIKGFSAGPLVLSPAIKGVPFAWVLSG